MLVIIIYKFIFIIPEKKENIQYFFETPIKNSVKTQKIIDFYKNNNILFLFFNKFIISLYYIYKLFSIKIVGVKN